MLLQTYNDCYNSFQETNLEDDDLVQMNENRKDLIQHCNNVVNNFNAFENDIDRKWKLNHVIKTIKYKSDDTKLFDSIVQHGIIEHNLILPRPIITNICNNV